MPASERMMCVCLLGVVVSLLLVGVVSGTVVRHLVQVAPACLALAAIRPGRASWGTQAAQPIFIFWFFIMGLIWLFLLGVSRIVTGHFTLAEIALTLVIGACCAWGMVTSLGTGGRAGWAQRVLAFGGFLLLQIAAMWLSTRPGVANR